MRKLGRQIEADYHGKPLTIVAVLTGSLIFLADLIRQIELPHRVALLQASSYRGPRRARGALNVNEAFPPEVSDRDVLLLDDILDTGHTLATPALVARMSGRTDGQALRGDKLQPYRLSCVANANRQRTKPTRATRPQRDGPHLNRPMNLDASRMPNSNCGWGIPSQRRRHAHLVEFAVRLRCSEPLATSIQTMTCVLWCQIQFRALAYGPDLALLWIWDGPARGRFGLLESRCSWVENLRGWWSGDSNQEISMAEEVKKAVVLLSGGLDSATAAAEAKAAGFEVYALTILYGQRHAVERDAARRVAKAAGVARYVEQEIDLARFGASALTDDIEVPKDRSAEVMRSGDRSLMFRRGTRYSSHWRWPGLRRSGRSTSFWA